MDGTELVKQLRDDSTTAAIPILLYTGLSVTDIEPVIHAGVDKVLYKPLDLEQMIDYVADFFKPANVQ